MTTPHHQHALAHHEMLATSASSGATTVPLHCNVCPKKPDFSDVSHLLTHIASKSHLSNYFKLKVKSDSDAASKILLDEYNTWYEVWNLQDLMAERMNQKDKRKGNGSGVGTGAAAVGPPRARASANSGAPSRAPSARATPVPVNLSGYRAPSRLRENTLDPQLGPKIKIEPGSRSSTPLPSRAQPFVMDPAAMHRSYAPPMQSVQSMPQSWPHSSSYAPSANDEASVSWYSPPDSGDSDEIDLPALGGVDQIPISHETAENIPPVFDEDPELEDTLTDAARLKGVYWEGMGMFDSATMDMRRKRNQKKAVSVVQLLKAASEVIDPTEMVFDADGQLRRERFITGNVESDDGGSPLKGESSPEPDTPPPKKKAGRRPRAALVEKNANSGRNLRRRTTKRAEPQRRTAYPSTGSKRGPYFDGVDDEDDDLTYGRRQPKKRSGLSIHRDNSGPEITFDDPSGMTTLTSGFRSPFHGDNSPHQPPSQSLYRESFHNRGHQRDSNLSYTPGFRPVNNNNGQSGGYPPVGSFGSNLGHLNPMFPNASFPGPQPYHNGMSSAAISGGAQALAAFQQQMAGSGNGGGHSASFSGDAGSFFPQDHSQQQVQHHGQHHMQPPMRHNTPQPPSQHSQHGQQNLHLNHVLNGPVPSNATPPHQPGAADAWDVFGPFAGAPGDGLAGLQGFTDGTYGGATQFPEGVNPLFFQQTGGEGEMQGVQGGMEVGVDEGVVGVADIGQIVEVEDDEATISPPESQGGGH